MVFQQYVSASVDGSIKIWDGVSSQCVATFPAAHDGAPVSSVAFTRNGKYVLSAGKDSLVKLWELSTTRCLIAYTGAGATGKQVRAVYVVQYRISGRSNSIRGAIVACIHSISFSRISLPRHA